MAIHRRGAFFVLDSTDGNGKRHRRRFKTLQEAEAAAQPSTDSDFARVAKHYLAYIEANKRPDTVKNARSVVFSARRCPGRC